MKNTLIAFCLAFVFFGIAFAQPQVKIGNMELTFRKSPDGTDTVVQITINDKNITFTEKPKRQEPERKVRRRYDTSSWYIGMEFTLPDHGSDYLSIYGGKSYQFNTGYRYCFHPVRWYGIGVTAQYAFYNYRLKDASLDLIGQPGYPYKEVFRSNNLGVGVFNRFYIIPGKHSYPNSNGVYIDAGVQGEWGYSRFVKTKTKDGDYKLKTKYRNGYAFNPFTASAYASLGFGWMVFTAHYRFTDIFNSDEVLVDLPPITIGMQFSIDW